MKHTPRSKGAGLIAAGWCVLPWCLTTVAAAYPKIGLKALLILPLPIILCILVGVSVSSLVAWDDERVDEANVGGQGHLPAEVDAATRGDVTDG